MRAFRILLHALEHHHLQFAVHALDELIGGDEALRELVLQLIEGGGIVAAHAEVADDDDLRGKGAVTRDALLAGLPGAVAEEVLAHLFVFGEDGRVGLLFCFGLRRVVLGLRVGDHLVVVGERGVVIGVSHRLVFLRAELYLQDGFHLPRDCLQKGDGLLAMLGEGVDESDGHLRGELAASIKAQRQRLERALHGVGISDGVAVAGKEGVVRAFAAAGCPAVSIHILGFGEAKRRPIDRFAGVERAAEGLGVERQFVFGLGDVGHVAGEHRIQKHEAGAAVVLKAVKESHALDFGMWWARLPR